MVVHAEPIDYVQDKGLTERVDLAAVIPTGGTLQSQCEAGPVSAWRASYGDPSVTPAGNSSSSPLGTKMVNLWGRWVTMPDPLDDHDVHAGSL